MQAPAVPGTGDKLNYADLKDALLHITVHEVVKGVSTIHGTSDAVRADVVALDGGKKGESFDNVLIFPKVLQGQLSGFAGTSDPTVVGRLGQGVAKPGKNAPWELQAPTAEDMATATKYEAYAAQRTQAQEEPF